MVAQVHQLADQIYVRTDAGTYGDTRANFTVDNQAEPPPMPAGITERIYDQGRRHALNRDHDTVDGGPMPWPEGDELLGKIQSLLVAQAERQQAEALALKARYEAEAAAKAGQAP